jgi:FAD/FMN-containing dehydrogenase
MTDLTARLKTLLGDSAVERTLNGLPRAVPTSTDCVAAVLGTAHEEGWRVRVEGSGSWLCGDAPCDLILSTRGLDRITAMSGEDLVGTAEAGVELQALRRRLADRRLWLAVDPPGRPERTIGSVVVTGTSGPLRAGLGPVKDHLLGCTIVTGDGRIVRPGGKVVKNVAGYDLTKLMAGGFGAFGVVTDLHLRLRAMPERDATCIAKGARDALTYAARELIENGLDVQAIELFSPSLAGESEWVLAVRAVGSQDGIASELGRLDVAPNVHWVELGREKAAALWHVTERAFAGQHTCVRLGVFPDGVDETIDHVLDRLGDGLISASMAAGGLRWSGDTTAERLREVRRTLAAREIPMTVERAAWSMLERVGHFGAYREGVATVVTRLRSAFDPKGRLQVALDGCDDA